MPERSESLVPWGSWYHPAEPTAAASEPSKGGYGLVMGCRGGAWSTGGSKRHPDRTPVGYRPGFPAGVLGVSGRPTWTQAATGSTRKRCTVLRQLRCHCGACWARLASPRRSSAPTTAPDRCDCAAPAGWSTPAPARSARCTPRTRSSTAPPGSRVATAAPPPVNRAAPPTSGTPGDWSPPGWPAGRASQRRWPTTPARSPP